MKGTLAMNKKLYTMTATAMLMGIVVLMSMVPFLGFIPLGFVDVTLLCLPVLIGALALGYRAGLFVGAAFATMSLLKAFGVYSAPSAMMALLAAHPLILVPCVLLPRLAIPLTARFVYQKTQRWPMPLRLSVSAVAGSLTNTLLFLGTVFLLGGTVLVDGAYKESLQAVAAGFAAIVLSNGIPEAIGMAILIPPVVMALQRMKRDTL